MKAANSRNPTPRVGPYSRILQNGAGEGIDGRTRDGKFIRRCEAELLAQIEGDPSFTQRLLVRRVAKMMFVAERLDEKLTGADNWTPHDCRTFGALNTAIARALRDLGLKNQPKAKAPTLADYAAQKVAQRPVAK